MKTEKRICGCSNGKRTTHSVEVANGVKIHKCLKCSEGFADTIKGKCRKCGSQRLDFYDGCLGYEAIVCRDCGEHHTNETPIEAI